MTFKVKDLMIQVGAAGFEDGRTTCTWPSRTTGTACIDTLLFRADAQRRDLAALKLQLRQAMARS